MKKSLLRLGGSGARAGLAGKLSLYVSIFCFFLVMVTTVTLVAINYYKSKDNLKNSVGAMVHALAVNTGSDLLSRPVEVKRRAQAIKAGDSERIIAFDFVGPDGKPVAVRIVMPTGIDELDRVALDTARQWKFRPATRDGQPVEGKVRMHIEFQVN